MSLVLAFISGWLGVVASAAGQSTAAQAAQEEAEERYRKLSAQVEELRAAQDLRQQEVSALRKSVQELADRVARPNTDAATQESVKRLADHIQKVDEARVAENKKIFDAIDELHRILKNLASAPPPRASSGTSASGGAGRSPAPTARDKGYEYKVEKNDTLSGIVAAYRAQNIKVTSKAIVDANPDVKWDRLKVGQKIWIPEPKSQ